MTTLSTNLRTLVVDFVESLAPASAGAALLSQGLRLSFDNYNAISVPDFVSDADNVAFVAEAAPIPVKELTARRTTLEPRKLASIVVLTNEMLNSSNAEALVRDCLTRAAALALDRAMLDANAADAARPAGLRHGITALTASTASDPHAAMIEDLTSLTAAVSPVAGNASITVIADAPRAMTIKLRATRELPFAVLASAAAGNDVIAFAPPALVSATGGIDLDSSREVATLHMEGAAPVHISETVLATPVRSLWQTDSTGLKLRMITNWALRDARAIAWLTPTNW